MATRALLPEPAPLAETRESLLAVPGIHCAGCISKIENGLPKVNGIESARVNMGARRVAIRHDAALSPPDLKAALARLGFEAEALADPGLDVAAAENRALLRALAVAGFAAMNIMLLSVSIWSGAEGATRQMFHWLSALIALPTVAYAGEPFFRSAWAALRQGRTNMDVPISIGVLLTTSMSLFETISGGAHAWFDGAVMLLFFLLAGRCLDSMMRGRARAGVAALLKQTAPGALVLDEAGQSRWSEADVLRPGMRMLVAAGERLAADGRVLMGDSSLDISFLTGESTPVRVQAGDVVQAGALNVAGPLTVEVTAAGADTVIADIARLMEEAGQSKSHYVRLADRAARWYAPCVHLLAALSFIGWTVGGAGVHQSLLIAVAVLLITCPCALGLAVPVAQVVACGALMRQGVLVKDGSALERLAETTEAVFDKTGTLTLGRPVPRHLDRLDGEDHSILLALAQASRHPLSVALRQALEAEGVRPATLDPIREVPGEGLFANHRGVPVSLARPRSLITLFELASEYRHGADVHLLPFTDALRPDAAETLAALRAAGLQTLIASGDQPEALEEIARATGTTAIGRLRPADKLALLDRIKAQGQKVLMVGDGLNDGPALAAGHASIAPASASDASQLAADIVFLGDRLAPVAIALRAARRTIRVVKQNFALAICYNILAVPLAIAGKVTPLVAAVAMSLSSLIVILNALRLKDSAK
ncbi:MULTISPECIES: heavy metal translocating P-type ATPase [Sphingobium]|uniref:Cadmium-translocating P-type ATPase n=2 Tax=Sphingobium TaxID=165695 RepID=A0A437J3Y8_9SPHN|nr:MULTISPECIES: copper-translocating P-type ATPase [Sphingobium]EQB12501.1 ATPase [Sphingobium lactosutens DS20]RVT39215.1 cadmium-translocating P-type ATPase [Sphingobium algorifonticola]